MIEEALGILSRGEDLTAAQMTAAMEEIMSGEANTAEIVSFLTSLSEKGESIEELTTAVGVMRRYVTKINTKHKIILDTCGTGGDKKGTFNISTIVAFVASGCGIAVAKHGNRSVSSCCGSADILEALGVNIHLSQEQLKKCLDEIGIAFLFAQNLHPAMKYASQARKQIGKRTMFNILGPLTNPAGATHQLVGVYDKYWTQILAKVLANLGAVHALVVHGEDGLDEITTTAQTFVSEASCGKINNYEIIPEHFGINKAKLEDLSGGNIPYNVKIVFDVLNGKPGPKRDIVVLNAGAAVYASDKTKTLREGLKLAAESIDSGSALKKLHLLKEYSHQN